MRVLFVGAHPDDIEIGSAVLAKRLLSLNFDVRYLILSDEDIRYVERREEALEAAIATGVSVENIVFAGLVDGYISVSKDSVSKCRSIFRDWDWYPDLVVGHSASDSHQDHRNAHFLMRAVFRKMVYLSYSIFLSANSTFSPSYLLPATVEEFQTKYRILQYFHSQSERIDFRSLERWERYLGSMCSARCEAYEVILDHDSSDLFNDYIDSIGLIRIL